MRVNRSQEKLTCALHAFISRVYDFMMHRSAIGAQGLSRKRLAFTCAEGDLCGGLGDRLKGFVSAFILALLLDAEFVIEWTHPVRFIIVSF